MTEVELADLIRTSFVLYCLAVPVAIALGVGFRVRRRERRHERRRPSFRLGVVCLAALVGLVAFALPVGAINIGQLFTKLLGL